MVAIVRSFSAIACAALAIPVTAGAFASIDIYSLDGRRVYTQDSNSTFATVNGYLYTGGGGGNASAQPWRPGCVSQAVLSPGYLHGLEQATSAEAKSTSDSGDDGVFVSDTLPHGTPISVTIHFLGKVSGVAVQGPGGSSDCFGGGQLTGNFEGSTGFDFWASIHYYGQRPPVVFSTSVGAPLSFGVSVSSLSRASGQDLRFALVANAAVGGIVYITPPVGVRFAAASGHSYPRFGPIAGRKP